MLEQKDIEQLQQLCKQTRRNIIKMANHAKSGHIGGAFSAVEILTTLYQKVMNITPEMKPDRDRFVLSKGHASPLLYSILAMKGIIPKEELMTFRKFHSKLQGHPAKHYLSGIETSTGSLGQGLSIGCGMAEGLKLKQNPANVVVYTGDGELQEGSCWEAFMQAAHRKLDNLIAIIDRNKLQIDNLADKLRAFNWEVIEINGHDYNEIYEAVEAAKKADRPCAIIAHTTKGKGVSFMENQAGWHGKAPSDEQLAQALAELGE